MCDNCTIGVHAVGLQAPRELLRHCRLVACCATVLRALRVCRFPSRWCRLLTSLRRGCLLSWTTWPRAATQSASRCAQHTARQQPRLPVKCPANMLLVPGAFFKALWSKQLRMVAVQFQLQLPQLSA
jgi:hypothetical protein